MPIDLHNDYVGPKTDPLTMQKLVNLHQRGFSVMRTPHVGNQYPSNLLCAMLGFHMDMVTFTQGERDQNYHPHGRIEKGKFCQLYSPHMYTPFAQVGLMSAEAYHQGSIKRLFPQTTITVDVELMNSELGLAGTIFRIATENERLLWYRRVNEVGVVVKQEQPAWRNIEANIYRISNPQSGWIVPNRLSILYTLIWQCLASGRDKVYALSGPDMVRYIGGAKPSLSRMYDLVRRELPQLPEILQVFVPPVSQCRFVTHHSRKDSLDEVVAGIKWYERQLPSERPAAVKELVQIGEVQPEFTRPINKACFLSQYDLADASDLYVPEWVLKTPLGRIRNFLTILARGNRED